VQRDHIEQLAHSWQANAEAWTTAVRQRRIESRRLVTDAAILHAALALAPKRVLDLGCGEGWLCRELVAHDIEAVGVDACEALIAAAEAAGKAQYRVCGYAELKQQAKQLGQFELLLCNFALLEQALEAVLRSLHYLLAPGGSLLIQTLHPWSARDSGDYQDGWRIETFAGFGEGFDAPLPWYFRTLESWLALLHETGWHLQWLREPLHPQTKQPVSLLLRVNSAQKLTA